MSGAVAQDRGDARHAAGTEETVSRVRSLADQIHVAVEELYAEIARMQAAREGDVLSGGADDGGDGEGLEGRP